MAGKGRFMYTKSSVESFPVAPLRRKLFTQSESSSNGLPSASPLSVSSRESGPFSPSISPIKSSQESSPAEYGHVPKTPSSVEVRGDVFYGSGDDDDDGEGDDGDDDDDDDGGEYDGGGKDKEEEDSGDGSGDDTVPSASPLSVSSRESGLFSPSSSPTKSSQESSPAEYGHVPKTPSSVEVRLGGGGGGGGY